MQFLTIIKCLFENLAILHKQVNNAVKTITVIKSDLFIQISIGHDKFSIYRTCVKFSFTDQSAKQNKFTISLLIVLVVVTDSSTFSLFNVHLAVAMTIIIEIFSDVHLLIVWLD